MNYNKIKFYFISLTFLIFQKTKKFNGVCIDHNSCHKSNYIPINYTLRKGKRRFLFVKTKPTQNSKHLISNLPQKKMKHLDVF